MPALKQSTTHYRIYSGHQGKQFLLDSINFLFAIKGKEFHKLNPSFSTPDASEFIAYSHIVNRNLVGNRSKETNKSLDQFLKFICGKEIQGPALIRCIYVTTLALGAFSTTEYILMGSDEMSKNYICAFEWYTSQVMMCIQSNRDIILGTIGRFMDTHYFSKLPTLIKNFISTDEVSALAIGSYVIYEFHLETDMFDYIVQMPYLAMLYKKGYKAICKDFILDRLRMCELCD